MNKEMNNRKDKTPEYDLEQLLQSVEHAGRDSLRRQQLSDLIDQLAAKDAVSIRRPHYRIWTAIVSMAACIALFVTTVVRLTKTTETMLPSGPLTAQSTTDSIPSPSADADTVETPAALNETAPLLAYVPDDKEESIQMDEIDTIPIADTIVNVGEPELLLVEESSDDGIDNQIEIIADPIVSKGNDEPANTQAELIKNRRRLFRFRRTEASMMDGTMLAINIKL